MDDLLDSIDTSEEHQPAPSSMTVLEQRKQNEARAFSQGLLQSMAGGTNSNPGSSVGKRKSSECSTSNEGVDPDEGPSSSKQGFFN